jgi:predicted O-linked N-acetylglucosamine transferase (SPINDLY family)
MSGAVLEPLPEKLQLAAENALALQGRGLLEPARQIYIELLAQVPHLSAASFNLGLTYYPDRTTAGEAIYWFRHTLKYQPYHLKALMLLAESLYWNGEVEDSLNLVLKTLPEANPSQFSNWSQSEQLHLRQRQHMAESWLLKCMYALNKFNDCDFLRALRIWGQRWADPLKPDSAQFYSPNSVLLTPTKPLRVGYFSQEFGGFSSGFLILPLLAHHNREKFEWVAFSDSKPKPEQKNQFKAYFDDWHEVHGLSEKATAELIRAEKIDILVDLGGHTHPERLLVFGYKPAPIQVTGLGFGTPVAMRAMDAFITDKTLYPSELQSYMPEKIYYLDTALHWQPPALEIPVKLKPQHTPFIFGSANGLYKLDPVTLQTWAEILRACPESLLWLKAAPLSGEASRKRMLDFFSQAGIASQRLILEGITPPFQHLDIFYNGIDLALDPFPYNGGVTSCDALWMGVPVLSLQSRNRCGMSILTSMKMPEWLAIDRQDYFQKACQIYQDRSPLVSLKFSLRERLLASPICQMPAYAQQVEAVYFDLWQKYLNRWQ